MNEEIIDILKEFDEKRVEQLSENSRKLFYAVMSIADDRDRLKQENNKLKIDISARETVCDDYKSRIDKAIEYIDKLWSFPDGNYEIAINERDSIDIDGNDYFDNLLNILNKGE